MMTADRKTVEIFVEIKRRAQKAVLVSDGAVEVWLPLSLIDIEPGSLYKFKRATITLPEWLAKEKGLI
ncbi:MAG: hypothetical protein WC343_09530 [Bacilli bacterium]|jgi:hypothetical protein